MKKNLLSILALGIGLQSFAQIVYTDITDVTLTPTATRESLDIDFNNDGTADFTVFALDTSHVEFGQTIPVKGIAMSMPSTNMVDGSNTSLATGQVLSVTAHTSGNAINSSLSFTNPNSGLLFPGGALSVSTSFGDAGNFEGSVDQFVAVSFEISSSTHYGWIRVNTADDAANITIKDFAYESTAGTAINAGATGGVSINENELADAEVFLGNSELNINGISGTYSVTVVDLLGKSISNTTQTNNSIITLDNINNGIYLVKIAKGTAVVTKKVYIK